ncbi:hypothetical protein [Streptomyces sp. Z26]|uniref:hypothetical protein n=1 Tax=Streptomyces sp. Z26 TaxID=2500177 RepID=UPI0019D1475C|nr:hypothetical protein [Streptomyces sp. Z26]
MGTAPPETAEPDADTSPPPAPRPPRPPRRVLARLRRILRTLRPPRRPRLHERLRVRRRTSGRPRVRVRVPLPPVRRLRRVRPPRWWPLAACVALGAAGGAAYGQFTPPSYSATSYVAVVPAKNADPASALGFAQAYGRIATGGAVLAGARAETGKPLSVLEKDVQAVTSPDAPLIEISGTAARPAGAATVANAVAGSLTRVANRSAERTEVRLTVFAAARAPSAPSSPSTPLAVAVGGCAGGLCGALLLLVRPTRRARDDDRWDGAGGHGGEGGQRADHLPPAPSPTPSPAPVPEPTAPRPDDGAPAADGAAPTAARETSASGTSAPGTSASGTGTGLARQARRRVPMRELRRQRLESGSRRAPGNVADAAATGTATGSTAVERR